MKHGDQVVTTAEAASLLGYKSSKSIYRLVTARRLKPLPVPKCPLHFWRGDVLAILQGAEPVTDRWNP